MAFLRATNGLEAGSICPLKPGINTIGRDERRCDVTLRHYAVSREHARIELLPDGAYIEDLHSRNGVLLNGAPLVPGVAGRQRLLPLDRISFAPFEFVFQDDGWLDTVAIADDQSDESNILTTVDVSSDRFEIFRQSGAANDTVDVAGTTTTNACHDQDKFSSSHELTDAFRKLSAVVTILEETSGQLTHEAAPERLLDSLLRVFPQTESSCLLLPDSNGQFFVAAVKNADGSDTPPRLSHTVLDIVVRRKQAALSGDARDEAAFSSSPSGQGLRVRSVMCVPLINSAERVVGIVELDTSRTSDFFTRDDLQIVAGVARHLALVIDNAVLHAAKLKAQQIEFEARFRRLIEESIHGVLIHRDFEPLFVNPAWAALHGYSCEEVLDLDSVLPLVTESDREAVVADARELLAGHKDSTRGERQDLVKDGVAIWVEEYATVIEWEGGPAIHSTVVDLTDRKQAEQVLRQSRDELEQRVRERTQELATANQRLQGEVAERVKKQDELRDVVTLYHSLLNDIPLCVVRKSVDGRVTYVNRSFCNVFGLAADHFLGKTAYDLFSPDHADKYRQSDEQVMETGKQLDFLQALPLPNGEIRQIHTLKTPAYDPDGQLRGTQLIFWDVTEQMRTEEERNRYAAELERSNRDLEQFAYSVSHDLQSPLRTVTSYCQLLQQECGAELASGDGQKYLSNAIDGTRRMRRLLMDLLAYSRASAGPREMEAVQLEEVLSEALQNLAAAIRDNQALITSDPLPTVYGDRTQLVQLFQNLINNSIAYRREQPPRVHVSVAEDATHWRFSVKDNGRGIAEKDFQRIFQLFQRLGSEDNPSGTGIGLSICQRVVVRHGGEIDVTSKKGEGCTFHFTLPKRSAGD